jgi:hypothetical protein
MDASSLAVAVIAFARAPVLGKVKTRLAAGVGQHHALELYRACAGHVLQQVAGCAVQPVLCRDTWALPDDFVLSANLIWVACLSDQRMACVASDRFFSMQLWCHSLLLPPGRRRCRTCAQVAQQHWRGAHFRDDLVRVVPTSCGKQPQYISV